MSRYAEMFRKKISFYEDRHFPSPQIIDKTPLLGAIGIIALLVMMGSSPSALSAFLAFGLGDSNTQPNHTIPACEIPFRVEETLMYPTRESVSLTMTPLVSTKMYIEYGTQTQQYSKKTAPKQVMAGEAAHFLINGLGPGNKYYYRVRCQNENNLRYGARDEHSFHTLRKEGETVSFIYGTDAHIYHLWASQTWEQTGPGGGINKVAKFNASMTNILNEEADFHVIGGDWVMTKCDNCEGGTYEGVAYAEGSTNTAEEALKRYQQTFSTDLYGQITKDLPFVYVLGNHEGEAGFNDDLMAVNREARQNFFPPTPTTYHANAEESYYSFETGDALIVVVDVMRYTNVGGEEPMTPEEWTLGPTQLEWLKKTMEKSTKKWKFIFAEHLDGGEPAYSAGNNTWYGRGGLRATHNDHPSGVFKGEQSQIQTIMEKTTTPGGAAFFLSGHDHVAINATEKPTETGEGTRTFMVKGGRLGSAGNGWANDAAFKTEMDWDLSGKADYDESHQGTREVGYYRITVNQKSSVTLEYILSEPDDPATNGTTLFSKTVYAV